MTAGVGLFNQPIFTCFVRHGKRNGLTARIARIYAQQQVTRLLQQSNKLKDFVIFKPHTVLGTTVCSARALFFKDQSQRLLESSTKKKAPSSKGSNNNNKKTILNTNSKMLSLSEGSRRNTILRQSRGQLLSQAWNALSPIQRKKYEQASALVKERRAMTRKLVKSRKVGGYALYRAATYQSVLLPSQQQQQEVSSGKRKAFKDSHLYRSLILTKRWKSLSPQQREYYTTIARRRRELSAQFIQKLTQVAGQQILRENAQRKQLQAEGSASARRLFGPLMHHSVGTGAEEEPVRKRTTSSTSSSSVRRPPRSIRPVLIRRAFTSTQKYWWRSAESFTTDKSKIDPTHKAQRRVKSKKPENVKRRMVRSAAKSKK